MTVSASKRKSSHIVQIDMKCHKKNQMSDHGVFYKISGSIFYMNKEGKRVHAQGSILRSAACLEYKPD